MSDSDPTPRHGPAFVLVDDMIFSSKITGTARQVALETRTHRDAATLADALADADARLLIVDLAFRGGDSVEAIAAVRADGRLAGLPIIAFGSHVETDRLAAAGDAGADEVMPRSAFSQHLPRLLSGYAD